MAKLWDASVAWLNQKLLVKIFSLVSIWLSVLERKIKLLNLLLEASHRKDELVCPVQTVAMNPAQTGQCALFTLQIPSPEWQTHPGQHSWSTGSCLRLCVHTDMFAWYNGGVWPLVLLSQTHQVREAFSQAFGNEWPAMVLKRCGLLLQTNTYELCVFTTGRKL